MSSIFHLISKWKIAFLSTLALVTMVACSSSKQGSLITDQTSLSDCPQKSCAQGIADPADTKVVLTTPLSNVLPQGNTFAEVAGDCYVSLYTQNYFEVQITGSTGVNLTNYFPVGFTPRCNQGKFYFPINLQGLALGSYSLTAQLVVVDTNGTLIKPPFKTINSTIILR